MSKVRAFACFIAGGLTIIAGIILIISASVFIKETNYLHDLWTQIYGLSIFSVIIGALAIIFGIGLVYVVNREFPALTTLFSGFFIVVVFLSAICVVILITGRNNFERNSYDNIEQLFHNYSDSDSVKSSKTTLSQIQQSFECCGVKEATDWKNQYPDKRSTPDSCCKKMVAGCGNGSLITFDKIYSRGCAEPVYFSLRKKYPVLIGMNFVVMILALISAILGFVFERYIRQKYQYQSM